MAPSQMAWMLTTASGVLARVMYRRNAGIATAARIPRIVTTIINSTRVKARGTERGGGNFMVGSDPHGRPDDGPPVGGRRLLHLVDDEEAGRELGREVGH